MNDIHGRQPIVPRVNVSETLAIAGASDWLPLHLVSYRYICSITAEGTLVTCGHDIEGHLDRAWSSHFRYFSLRVHLVRHLYIWSGIAKLGQ